MPRTLHVALFAALALAGCKSSDKPAAQGEAAAKPHDPTNGSGIELVPEPIAPGSAAPSAPVAPVAAGSNTPLQNRGIAMMQQLADLFAANEKDCEQLARALTTFTRDNKKLYEELTEMEKKLSEAEREAFETRNQAVQEAVIRKITPAVTACRGNANVEAAMNALPN